MFKPLPNAPFFRYAALMAVTLTSRRGGRPKKRLCGNAIHYVFNYSAAPTRASYGFPADKDLLSEEKVLPDATITTLATARLRFLFLAARIWRHAGRVGVSYSDHYQEKGAFQQLMERLRKVARGPDGFAPVLAAPLRA
jgi:hypothetical protein